MVPNLTLPHATQTECSNGYRKRQTFMRSSSKVLSAGRQSAQVHGDRAAAHADKCNDHSREGPAVFHARWSSTVCQSSQKVSRSKEDGRCERERSGVVSVTQIPKQRHRQIHGQFSGGRNSVDLELGVAKMLEEQRSV